MSDFSLIREVAETNPETLPGSASQDYLFRYIDLSSVNSGSINWNSVPEINMAEAPSRARRVIRTGDVLFGTVRPNLQSHGFVKNTTWSNLIASTGFSVIRAKPGVSDPDYLFHCVMSDGVFVQSEQHAVGSSYPALNDSDVRNFKVFIPSLKQQQKIAHILTTVDNLIEKTQALIDKYTAVKQGMMHDLFTRGIDLATGQLRPSYEQAPELYKETELGWVPREWAVVILGDIAEFFSGYAFKNHELTEHGMKVVRISNLHKPDFYFWRYDGTYKDSWLVEDGDLLFSWAGVASSIDAYIYRGEKSLLNQHIYNFKFQSETVKVHTFNYLQFILPKLREDIEGGAGQLHLSKGKIQSIALPMPSKEELYAINARAGSLDKVVEDESAHLDQLLQTKKGLMQDLLTGRVLVNG